MQVAFRKYPKFSKVNDLLLIRVIKRVRTCYSIDSDLDLLKETEICKKFPKLFFFLIMIAFFLLNIT